MMPLAAHAVAGMPSGPGAERRAWRKAPAIVVAVGSGPYSSGVGLAVATAALTAALWPRRSNVACQYLPSSAAFSSSWERRVPLPSMTVARYVRAA